jgi:hypothetical protein
MKNKIDWSFLKRSLIFLFIAIVFAAIIIFFGMQYEDGKYNEYTAAKSSLSATHNKYKKLVEDLDLIHLYTKTYTDYRSSGLVGSERRLSWIETLESVNDVLKLPKLTYALAPQQGFSKPKLKVDRAVQVNSTPMDLKMDLLHEEDLFAVFEGIDGIIKNLYTLDSCSIKRRGAVGSSLSTKNANLSADCKMRWITIDVKK